MDAVHSHDDVPSSESGKGPISGSDENRPPLNAGSDRMPAPVGEPCKFGATLFDRNRGPRPPVPGEETTSTCSDGNGSGGSSSSPPPPPPPLDPWKKKQILRSMEMSKGASPLEETPSANERPADFAPEGSAAESERTSRTASPSNRSDCSSSSSSSSSSIRGRPPCFSWANSLKNLLGDSEGVELFQAFLEQEQCPSQPLQFWFACRGFTMQVEQGQTDEDVEKLGKLIYRKFLRTSSVAVSEQTRRAIVEKLGLEKSRPDAETKPGTLSASSPWSTIFGRAQQEVEEALSRSTYANFLESDLYLQAVTEQIERRRKKKLEREERKKNKLLRRAGKVERASGGGVGKLPHVSSQPTSAQPLAPSQFPLPSLPEETTELHDEKKIAAPTTTLPLTRNALLATVTDRLTGYSSKSDSRQPLARPMSPHDARSSASSLSGVSSSAVGLTHPYHAMYKSYVPVSRQDSELQSLSSDALTDDTMSTLTDDCASSVDGFGGRGPGCTSSCCVKPPMKHGGLAAHHLRLGGAVGFEREGRAGGGGIHMHAGSQSKWQRRIQRQIRLNAEQNKESVRVTETYFIPRTERPIAKEEALAEKNPPEFAKILVAKLEALKRELESKPEGEPFVEERWKASALSLLPPQLLTEAMQEKFKAEIVDNLDSDQSILDNHVNRVWNDSGQQTPRTPPVPAKRPGLPPFPSGLRSSSRATGPIAGQPYVYASGKPPAYPSMNPGGEQYHHHRSHHHRKRDKDAVSSLSSDSGNVFDSRSSLDGVGLSAGAPAGTQGYGFPKSKSIPDWLADTHHASSRQHGAVPMLRSAGERGGPGGGATTDSGVSATSADSSANATAHQPISPTKERVLSWMLRNEKYGTVEAPGGAAVVGGSERGSSHRQSRASSAAGGQHQLQLQHQQQHQGPQMPGSSSRSSHRRHVSSSGNGGGGGGSGSGPSGASARSMSVERNSRLSWKQQYQQQLHEQQAAAAAGAAGTSSMDDSGVHFMRSAAAKLLSAPALSKTRGFHVSSSGSGSVGGKNEVIVSGGVGVDDDSGTSTVIGWVYCDEPVPYRSRLPGTQVSLKQFKQLLPRKGHYRYFFKKEDTEFGSGVVQEEISDDSSLLPLWEGKVFAIVKPM